MPSIAIIGAGFSGLRCADVLLRLGAKVTIFEARDRTGGRVAQAVQDGHDGHVVDMGPNWIHGTDGNPIMSMAKKLGNVVFEPSERNVIFDQAGLLKPEKESNEISAEVWATVIDALKYSKENRRTIDARESLFDFFRREVPKRFPSHPSKVHEILKEAYMWGPFVGDSIETQSLRCFFLEETLDGENVFLASTYSDILDEVQKKAMQGAHIRLNEEIVKIEYRNDAKQDEVSLTTRQGEVSTFDEVVVTCPLGWLKRNGQAFVPRLPHRLEQAIDNLGYGRLEKLFVTFPAAFWLTAPDATSCPTLSADSASSSASATITPSTLHFQSPLYHPDPATRSSNTFNQSVVSLAHMPGKTAHPTLLFYFYGDCGAHLTSMVASFERHSPEYNKKLTDFVLPFISRLPTYSATNADCVPTSLLLTSWQTDPFAGYGSYSNYQVGLQEGDVDIETIRNAGGLSEEGRGLWFAGEHTAPLVASGTTTGAYWSGEAVARRIGEAYKLVDSLPES